ncbi:MAG TPA: phosphoribosylformylglycinamidine cyclo-ligase [Actinomycetota bacterium]|nr:phosphoribosylformylglycinamidine cyclo-ligase [Actinomycetota bacterium]
MNTEPPARRSATYADAGVDIAAGERAVELFRNRVRATDRAEVIGGIGGFAGLFSLGRSKYKQPPLLVSATDGVGTKVMIAQQMGIHHTVGIDLVAMSANDVAVQGAEPLFFLDYIVTGKVIPELIEQIVSGVAEGCLRTGCALLGGEVAEHPGHFKEGDYDLAGFCVGAVEEGKVLTGASMVPGDVVIGLNSSGLHSNGFSLVRKIIEESLLDLHDQPAELDRPLGEELLTPTLMYWPVVAALHPEDLARGFAHITGGGLAHNLGRIIPPGLQAVVERSAWTIPPIFRLIASEGVSTAEMFRTFNMGIGMVAVVDVDRASRALEAIAEAGYAAQPIGVIRARPDDSTAEVILP